jgi:hypothetical protein
MPEGLRVSKEAFLRDLPQLLLRKKLRKKWVAYHGSRRLGFDVSETALYQKCFRMGLREEQFYVGWIMPHEEEPEEIDPHFWEFEEIA